MKKPIHILLPVAVFLFSLGMSTATPFSGNAIPAIESGLETVFSNTDASDIPLQFPIGQRAGHGVYFLDTIAEKETVDSQNNSVGFGSGRTLYPEQVPEVFFAYRIVDLGFELKKFIYPFHFFF